MEWRWYHKLGYYAKKQWKIRCVCQQSTTVSIYVLAPSHFWVRIPAFIAAGIRAGICTRLRKTEHTEPLNSIFYVRVVFIMKRPDDSLPAGNSTQNKSPISLSLIPTEIGIRLSSGCARETMNFVCSAMMWDNLRLLSL